MTAKKIAVVTGASRGIGLAIAHALADLGTELAICGVDADRIQRARDDISRKTKVSAVVADVSRADDVARLFETCRRELGPVDWLVNNAGVVERNPLAMMTEAQFDRVVGVNLKGPFLCAQAALPDLEQRGGRIVNIGSISGTLGSANMAPYNASKWGVNGLTLSWAEELKPKGVMVTCVQPGSVDTDMLKGSGFPPDMEPEAIAKIVKFLLADAPFAMTGSLVNAFG